MFITPYPILNILEFIWLQMWNSKAVRLKKPLSLTPFKAKKFPRLSCQTLPAAEIVKLSRYNSRTPSSKSGTLGKHYCALEKGRASADQATAHN